MHATNGNVRAMGKTIFLTVPSTVSKQIVDYYNPSIYELMFNYRIAKNMIWNIMRISDLIIL